MTRLLALDPGQTTGWSYWQYTATTPLVLLEHGQISGGNAGFARFSYAFLDEELPDEIVAESFVDDGRTRFPDLTPKQIEGTIESVWEIPHGVRAYWQRNTYKSHAPDDLLKKHDLWLRGQEHARDSVRHALALQKTRGHRPTIDRFWPRRRGLVALGESAQQPVAQRFEPTVRPAGQLPSPPAA